jgi:exonuclease III
MTANGGRGQRPRPTWRNELHEFRYHFVSQNARGLDADKEEELVALMGQQWVFISVVQETWCEDEALITERAGYTFVRTPATRSAPRGHAWGGLAVVFSPEVRAAWAVSGDKVHRFGLRVLAVHLSLCDAENRALEVMVICAYAPTSAAPAAEREEFLEQLRACVESRRSHEMLVIGGDFNAALGKRRAGQEEEPHVLGPWGAERRNAERDALLELIVEHDLCVAQSFFQKKEYFTWYHPGSRLGYQHDLWLVSKPDFKRVGDAGRRPSAAVDSDHTPVWVRLDMQRRSLQRFNRGGGGARGPSTRPAQQRHDTSALCNPEIRSNFINGVREAIDQSSPPLPPTSPPPTSLPTHTPLQDLTANRFATFSAMSEARVEELARAEDDRRAARQPSFSVLQAGVRRAADEHLPLRRQRPSPCWFTARQDELLPLIARRNATLYEYRTRPTLVAQRARESARAALRRAVRDAKRACLNVRINSLATDCKHPRVYWTALNELKGGLDRSSRVVPMRFRGPDGNLCEKDEDNANVLRAQLDSVYNRSTSVDQSVLELLPQLPRMDELADEPSAAEVAGHLKKAKKGKAPGDSGIAVECFQALADDAETLDAVHSSILDFWRSETACFEEWRVGRLKLLPKKGEPSDPSNLRGIMLLDKCGRNGLSLSTGLCQAAWWRTALSRSPVRKPPPGRNDCDSGGRRGTIPYHTMLLDAMAKVVASIVESRLALLLSKVSCFRRWAWSTRMASFAGAAVRTASSRSRWPCSSGKSTA